MKTSPFKVMTTAALATAIAVPAAATTADAAEVSIEKIAFSLDGEVQVVGYQDYVDAIISESGELYEYTEEATVAAIGVGDGVYVDYDKLVNAVLDAEEGTTAKEVLADLSDDEEALVDEETVATYKDFNASDELALSDVEAVGSKELQVEFTQALDSEEATIEVKKGAVTASVASVEFAEDNMSATINLSAKLTQGTYTVNVSGVADEVLTDSVEVQDEKVASIELLSDVAPLTDSSYDVDTTMDDATLAYKVENQYGEDITKFTSLNVNATKGQAHLDSLNGKVVLDSGANSYLADEKVTVTLIHPQTATSVVETVTISQASRVSNVELGSLYNKDGKALDEDANLIDSDYYIPVTAKDQYGNMITDTTQLNNDLIVNETNPTVVDVTSSFTTVEIDGETVPALKVNDPNSTVGLSTGQNYVTVISNTTGNSDSITLTVDEATRSDVISMSSPELVVAGEKAMVPVQVLDKEGNLITNENVLNSAVKGIDVTVGNATLSEPVEVVDGKTYVEVPAAYLASEGSVAIVAVSSSNQVSTLTLNVRAAAEPTVVTGLDDNFSKVLRSSTTPSFDYADLVVEDQYGRVMSDVALGAWLDSSANNEIVLSENTSNSVVTLSGATNGSVTLTSTSASATINAGSTNGTETLTTYLQDANGMLQGSNFGFDLRVTDGTEFTSYSVDEVGTVYDEVAAGNTDDNAYDKAVNVYGHLSDGGKVQLYQSEYSVTSTNGTVETDVQADSTIDATTSPVAYGTGETTASTSLTVTINATGEQFTQDVVFSKATPYVSSPKVVDEYSVYDASLDSVTTTASTTFDVASLTDLTGSTGNYGIVATDQYGASVFASANGQVSYPDGTNAGLPNLTITPVEGSIAINNNGTNNAAVTAASLDSDESFDVTITYPGGNSTTVRVTAQ